MKVSTANNLVCVCLFWLIILFSIVHISNLLYNNPDPAQCVYNIAGDNIVSKAAVNNNQSVSLAERLQQANIDNGRKVFGQCALCHTPVKNGPIRVGPPLWDIVGRSFASISNFTYSRAMRAEIGKIWDLSTLDAYLTSPKKEVPGTAMSFGGIRNEKDRADLILYLQSLTEKSSDVLDK